MPYARNSAPTRDRPRDTRIRPWTVSDAAWLEWRVTKDANGGLGPAARASSRPPSGWIEDQLGSGPDSLYARIAGQAAEGEVHHGPARRNPGSPRGARSTTARLTGSAAKRIGRALLRAGRAEIDDG